MDAWDHTTIRTKLTEFLLQQHKADSPNVQNASEQDVIDDIRPACVVRVNMLEHVATVTRFAYEHRLSVVVRGGGTQLHWGGVVERCDIVLDLSGLNRIVNYQPDDMTITVQCGCTLQQVQKTLAAGNQFLPVDPPLPDNATLGGIVATGAFGPLQHAYGPIRDYVIGMQAIRPNGDIVRFGSQVVKNAAGYELTKLFTGSYGTLGIITEITLMVRPRPATKTALLFPLQNVHEAEHIIEHLLHPAYELGFVELMNTSALCHATKAHNILQQHGATHGLFVGLFGSKQSVAWQRHRIESTCTDANSFPTVNVRPISIAWNDAYEPLHRARIIPSNESVLRAHVLSSEVVNFFQEAEHIVQRFQLNAPIVASVGLGIVHIALPAWPQRPQELIDTLQHAASQFHPVPNVPPTMFQLNSPQADSRYEHVGLGDLKALRRLRPGRIVVESAPSHIRRRVSIWSSHKRNISIVQRLQQHMNPRQTVNAGRLLGA